MFKNIHEDVQRKSTFIFTHHFHDIFNIFEQKDELTIFRKNSAAKLSPWGNPRAEAEQFPQDFDFCRKIFSRSL